MLLHLPALLGADDLREIERLLAGADWVDGRGTAGAQAAAAKNNQQLAEDAPATRALQARVLQALERNPTFLSATLPARVSPPMFNRYAGAANTFGDHVDAAVRHLPGAAGRMRSDLSCTLFLSDPADYDGGELVIEDAGGWRRARHARGDLVIYPATRVHRVEPVTRGARIAAFFWVHSMVRAEEQRRLLFDLDGHLLRLRSTLGDADPAVIGLTGTYHNLLRMWAEV